MATRLYMTYTQPGTTAPPEAGWEVQAASSGRLRPNKTGQAATAASVTRTVAGVVDMLAYRAITAPLDGDQTITGTFAGVTRFYESNSAADARAQCVVKVIAPDGSVRGILIPFDNGALANEFTTTPYQNRIFPRGAPAAVTPVAALSGDRIMLELGARMHHSGSNAYAVHPLVGDGGTTDAPFNETDTTAAFTPWIEFSQDLVFRNEGMLGRISLDVVTKQQGTGKLARISADVITKMQGTGKLARLSTDILVPKGMSAAYQAGWGVDMGARPWLNGYAVWIPDNSEFVVWPEHTREGDLIVIQYENGWGPPSLAGWVENYRLIGSNGGGWLNSKIMTADDILAGGVTLTAVGGSYPGAAMVVRIEPGGGGAPSVRAVSGFYSGAGFTSLALNSPAALAPEELVLWLVCSRVGGTIMTSERGRLISAQGGSNASSAGWYEQAPSAGVIANTFGSSGGQNRIAQAVMIARP